MSTPLPSVTGSRGETLLNLMEESAKPQYLLFKASIAVGLLLGVLLLGQTVLTYRFVRTGMVRQEARRDADRRVQSMIASATRAIGFTVACIAIRFCSSPDLPKMVGLGYVQRLVRLRPNRPN